MIARILLLRTILIAVSFLVSACVVVPVPLHIGAAWEPAKPQVVSQVGPMTLPETPGVIVCETEVILKMGVAPKNSGGCPPAADEITRVAHAQQVQDSINQITNSAAFTEGGARSFKIAVVTKKTPSWCRRRV